MLSAADNDLLTRTGSDIDRLGWSVRWALPEWTIAVVSASASKACRQSMKLVPGTGSPPMPTQVVTPMSLSLSS